MQRLQLLKPGVIMSSVVVALLIKSTMVPTLWSGLKYGVTVSDAWLMDTGWCADVYVLVW